MRILVISALYPPPVIGGAEVAAENLTTWLANHGHEMGVLTTAASPDDEVDGELIDGIRTWRAYWPRIYPIATFHDQPAWKKPIWHLQDHFDPRNRSEVARVVDAFKPDFVNIHFLQGIGYNALGALSSRDLPVLYVVNDLGLGCIRMSMFKDGHRCVEQCFSCRVSSNIKARKVARFDRIGFWSPSQATLDQLAPAFPVEDYPNRAIVYPNSYTLPDVPRVPSDKVRITYVGRLLPSKGVDVLLAAAEALADTFNFTVRIIGAGPSMAELRARFGHHPWLTFTGHVSQQEVANNLANSDLLCVPSVWAEPLGMVIVHALTIGVPVFGSRGGGIPELIDDGQNGMLLPPGDVEAWKDALRGVLADPTRLVAWRDYAERTARRFDQDALAKRVMDFAESIRLKQPEAAGGE